MSTNKPISSIDVYFKYLDEVTESLSSAIRFLESATSARNRYATGLLSTELTESRIHLGNKLNRLYTLRIAVLGEEETGQPGLIDDLYELNQSTANVLHQVNSNEQESNDTTQQLTENTYV